MNYFPRKVINQCVMSRNNQTYCHLSEYLTPLCYDHYLCDDVVYIEVLNIGLSSISHSLEELEFNNLLHYNYCKLCQFLNKRYSFVDDTLGIMEVFENFVRVQIPISDITIKDIKEI